MGPDSNRSVFEAFFRSGLPARDKFLSRLFGIFSEEVVRVWSACPEAQFEDIGRPTVRKDGFPRWATLDFTFRDRKCGTTFVAELKCELEFENYRYLTLLDAAQIRHHLAKNAFQLLVAAARNPTDVAVHVGGKPVLINGAVLVWGTVTPGGVRSACEAFGFADVLSLEQMMSDLQLWQPAPWVDLVRRYRSWSNELYEFMGPDV